MRFLPITLLSFAMMTGVMAPLSAQGAPWITTERISAANGGVMPGCRVQVVLRPVQDMTYGPMIELQTLTMTKGSVEIEVFSRNKTGYRLFKVIGGIQGDPVAEAREGQQRVRFRNTFEDGELLLVIRDVVLGKTARIIMSATNLDKAVTVWHGEQETLAAPNSPVRCEYIRAISDTCDIVGYGRVGTCLLNLVTCTVSECDTTGC